jgi:CheY-like chemotaxis protein
MNNHLPKILVVDDKAQNRALIAEYIEPLNVDIDEAASGEECLRLLKKNNYTLVLLDIQMPGLDGFQVLERMRGDEDLKEIPVVFISAIFNTEEILLKGIEKER